MRFDFSHFEALTEEQIQSIEAEINQKVLENVPVHSFEIDFKDKPEDIIAVFGEKYGERVRVVDIGGFSKELCGGTHVQASGEIGLFKIVSPNRELPRVCEELEVVCGQDSLSISQ